MRELIVFNHVTLDGYFVDANGQFRFGYDGNDDPEYQAFVAENASGGGEMLFGRKTYELMASYWPTAVADQHSPAVAAGMNNMSKVVFSKTLNEATWKNTRLVKSDMVAEIRRMKSDTGPGMVILGSGSVVAQLAQENLIDEYQMMFDPVVLGKGRTMFDGVPATLKLQLVRNRTFKNGKVYLCYAP